MPFPKKKQRFSWLSKHGFVPFSEVLPFLSHTGILNLSTSSTNFYVVAPSFGLLPLRNFLILTIFEMKGIGYSYQGQDSGFLEFHPLRLLLNQTKLFRSLSDLKSATDMRFQVTGLKIAELYHFSPYHLLLSIWFSDAIAEAITRTLLESQKESPQNQVLETMLWNLPKG